MIFARYEARGKSALGVSADGRGFVDLATVGGGLPGDLVTLIRDFARHEAALKAALSAKPTHQISEIKLLAPIPRPEKNVFCVGRNYREHVEEGYRTRGQETKLPVAPQFFTKPRTAIIGPDDPVPLDPKVTSALDYEVELGVIIGKTGKNIPQSAALDHIFGYTVINDVTARDLQRRHDQWFKGKGLDGSCPMGPVVVHKSRIPDPQGLNITLRINGETRQNSNTKHMIFDLKVIIEQLSLGMTLEAGDIIATGTPSGVGFAMTPPGLLKHGDLIEAELEGIGVLRNRVQEAGR
jgi:2-keto-4-pentenoate hydratase/2-oxohepta-3-ene-1,7-dioic acid hydratase in catechol pathway